MDLLRVKKKGFVHTQNNQIGPLDNIHVQYTQTESIRLRYLTIRLDSHEVDPHNPKSSPVK